MVQAMVNISENANQILNIIKAKYNLKDKSQAIDKIVLDYGYNLLEPELRPEFVQKMNLRQKEETVKIKDFKKHFGI
jgi:hypothetical protein